MHINVFYSQRVCPDDMMEIPIPKLLENKTTLFELCNLSASLHYGICEEASPIVIAMEEMSYRRSRPLTLMNACIKVLATQFTPV
jgi:hypothetical protein